ncbi:hypothetical protein M0804_010959 [Polistes exclamans]|nr:hypothetical protein M0804_010959 [Polistes exclamans]
MADYPPFRGDSENIFYLEDMKATHTKMLFSKKKERKKDEFMSELCQAALEGLLPGRRLNTADVRRFW